MATLSFNVNVNGETIPYITSTTEFGCYSGLNTTQTANLFNSCPIASGTTSNNGLASVASDGHGLTISTPGTYRLTLSLDITASGSGGSPNTIYFAFGTSKLNNSNDSSNNFFGGSPQNNMYSYGSNSTSTPGIISWLTNSYSSGNTTPGTLQVNNGYLTYFFYSKAANDGEQYSGICTTQITFTINDASTIYFNIASNAPPLNIGYSYYLLELITTQTFIPPS